MSKTAAGERLVFVPSRFRELGVAFGGSVMVPLWVAAPLLLPILVIAAITGSGLVWGLFWAVLGLAVLAVAGLLVALVFTVSATMVRWIEFHGQGDEARVVIARFLRSSSIAAADLQRVVVVERLRLGRRKSIGVVLHTRGGTVDCDPGFRAPLSEAGTEPLVDWLTGRLGPALVAVELRAEVDRNFACPAEWWTQSYLAGLWNVPVGAVDELADRHGVRSHRYTPRESAMYSPHRTVTVYDPGRAYEVAEELRAERRTGREAGGADDAPHPPVRPPRQD